MVWILNASVCVHACSYVRSINETHKIRRRPYQAQKAQAQMSQITSCQFSDWSITPCLSVLTELQSHPLCPHRAPITLSLSSQCSHHTLSVLTVLPSHPLSPHSAPITPSLSSQCSHHTLSVLTELPSHPLCPHSAPITPSPSSNRLLPYSERSSTPLPQLSHTSAQKYVHQHQHRHQRHA